MVVEVKKNHIMPFNNNKNLCSLALFMVTLGDFIFERLIQQQCIAVVVFRFNAVYANVVFSVICVKQVFSANYDKEMNIIFKKNTTKQWYCKTNRVYGSRCSRTNPLQFSRRC